MFPMINKDIQKDFEATCKVGSHVPEICGYKGRACRQMDKAEGANRALCFGCNLAEFAKEA